ncbi:hypothetical protein QTP88_007574 [Uroleucon formosanum]
MVMASAIAGQREIGVTGIVVKPSVVNSQGNKVIRYDYGLRKLRKNIKIKTISNLTGLRERTNILYSYINIISDINVFMTFCTHDTFYKTNTTSIIIHEQLLCDNVSTIYREFYPYGYPVESASAYHVLIVLHPKYH